MDVVTLTLHSLDKHLQYPSSTSEIHHHIIHLPSSLPHPLDKIINNLSEKEHYFYTHPFDNHLQSSSSTPEIHHQVIHPAFSILTSFTRLAFFAIPSLFIPHVIHSALSITTALTRLAFFIINSFFYPTWFALFIITKNARVFKGQWTFFPKCLKGFPSSELSISSSNGKWVAWGKKQQQENRGHVSA